MRYLCWTSAIVLFLSIAAAGSPWPGSLLALVSGAISTIALFASARRTGLFDPARSAAEGERERDRYRKAA